MARPSLRDTCILGLVAVGAVLAAFGGWRFAKASAPVSGPIIFVSIDGLGADAVATFGASGTAGTAFASGTGTATPAIDRLVQDGVVFEHAYTHATLALPAHTAVLTGRLPFQTGVRDNVGFSVPKTERLLQEVLRDRGYATAGIVSTAELNRSTGINRGFLFFDDALPERTPQMASWPAVRSGADAERVAEHWLESTRTPRAFLFLHLGDLRATTDPTSLSATSDRLATTSNSTSAAGGLSAADAAVDRLVRYLKSHQAYDQSTIVLIGDHGASRGLAATGGTGLLLDEAALRVPLVIKRPAGEGAGRRVRALVQLADVAPTILDLAKAPIPGNASGRSLKPLLDGADGGAARMIYSEAALGYYHFGWPHTTSVTDGRFRFVRGLGDGLFDLQRDPSGRTPVVNHDVSRALAQALDALVGSSGLPAPTVPLDTASRERLEALGNVTGLSVATQDGGAAAASRPAPDVATDVIDSLRLAVRMAAGGEWRVATDRLRLVLRAHPELRDGWRLLARIAATAGRHDVAIDARRHVAQTRPDDPTASLELAAALFDARRWSDARSEAAHAVALVSGGKDAVGGAAHELMARLALVERSTDDARRHAVSAEAVEPGRPVGAFVDCRIAHDAAVRDAASHVAAARDSAAQDAAFSACERAVRAAEAAGTGVGPIRDLYALMGESFLRLERDAEAEHAFQEELKAFPLSVGARVGLATVYYRAGRTDEVEQEIAALGGVAPVSEAAQAAARFWTAMGEPKRAQEARRLEPRRTEAAADAVRSTAASDRDAERRSAR